MAHPIAVRSVVVVALASALGELADGDDPTLADGLATGLGEGVGDPTLADGLAALPPQATTANARLSIASAMASVRRNGFKEVPLGSDGHAVSAAPPKRVPWGLVEHTLVLPGSGPSFLPCLE